jgi:hypothetical protein
MTNRPYNPSAISKMSTEKLERKLASAQADLKAKGRGHVGEAYYKQSARAQAVSSVQLWSAALADRKAGLV